MKRRTSGKQKVGMIIMMIAGIVMAILVAVSEPVPDLIAWIFFAVPAISIASALFVKKRRKCSHFLTDSFEIPIRGIKMS